jgi:hypothetical protein
MTAVPTVNDEETMVWLERSLEQARGRGQEKLARLLEAVRVEVIFEMELLEAKAWRRTED